MWDAINEHLKEIGIQPSSLLAAFVGALVACGFMPKITYRQAFTVVCAGTAVDAYLVPLALHLLNFPASGPLVNAIGFLAGLLGMRVIIIFMKWAEKIESPADLLHPFKEDR